MSHTPEQIEAAANFLDQIKAESPTKEQDLKVFLLAICNSESEKNEKKGELKTFLIEWEVARRESGSISILAHSKEEAEAIVTELDPESVCDGSVIYESDKVTWCMPNASVSVDFDYLSEAEEL